MADDNFDGADDALDPFLQSFFDTEMSAPLASGSHERVLSGVLQTLSAPQATTVVDTATSAATITTTKAVVLAIGSAVLGIAIGIGVQRRWLSETPSAQKETPAFEVAIASQPIDAGTESFSKIDARPSEVDAAIANIPQEPSTKR